MGEDDLDWPASAEHGKSWWEMDGDAELVESLARGILEGRGVALEGQHGAGQAHIARRVLARVSAYVRTMVLEREIDGQSAARLATIENEFRSALVPPVSTVRQRRSSLPRIVFLILDGHVPCGEVMEALSRMVVSGHACAITVTTDPHTGHETDLRRALRLESTRISAVPLGQARDFLGRGLGAPTSEQAAFRVWDGAAGNQSLMQLIAEDWREAGYLREVAGTWVVGGGEPPTGPRAVSFWRGLLAGLEERQREAFEILALCGTIPLALLMRVAGADAVDGIHALGHLEMGQTVGRTARIKGTASASAILGLVSPGRRVRLLEQAIDLAGEPNASQPALVGWRIGCGLPVGATDIVRAAEHAVESDDGTHALALLDAVPTPERDARYITVRLGALIVLGRLHEARSLVRMLPSDLRGPATGIPRREIPGGLRDVLAGTGPGAEASAEAELVDLVLAAGDGNFRPASAAPADRNDLPEHLSMLWRHSVYEARVMTGRVRDGLQADRDLVMLLTQSATAPERRERARLALYDLEMLSGEWENAQNTLEGQWQGATGSQCPGRSSPFHSGVVRAMTGRYDDAVSLLRPKIPQLQAQNRRDLLPLAHAASALSLAMLGDVAAARAELAAVEVPRLRDAGAWRITWTSGFLWAHAAGLLGNRDAVGWLVHAAGEDRVRGNVSQELLALSVAMQLGHEPAVSRLADSAELADGRFARACRLATRAYLEEDVAELEAAACLLHTLGQPLFAGFLDRRVATLDPRRAGRMEAHRTAAIHAQRPGSAASNNGARGKHAARPAFQTTEAGERSEAAIPDPGGRSHELLTRRQLSIVEHVLGDATNRQIAARLDLSVRTVESHLYQVYSKLGVKNREGLKAALAYLGDGSRSASDSETEDT